MLTQIYEVSSPDEARSIAAIGVDHIGVKVGAGEFPRELSVAAAATIAAAVPHPSKVSALFLTSDTALIAAWANALKPAIVHLGARPEAMSVDDVIALKQSLPHALIMRSVPVSGEASVAVARSYEGVADFLMLDTVRSSDQKIGALGVPHDWTISRRIVAAMRIPVFLAGGLGPENVADAIRLVQPAGVDSKTKTDKDGSHAKDVQRVRLFHEAARAEG